MALRNMPYRSEVLAWDPDSLADYFKKLNYKDCEKTVRKYLIDGARFLNLTENDIQKFPKLRVPILSKLSQEINKNEERRSIFTRKPQAPRFPEETESHDDDNGGWSSFEEDDYESPNEDQDGEDEGDYESPNEEEEAPVEDDADYEPPPSNDEEALQNSILPAKPFPNTNSMYIDRPPSGKVSQQPPVPPQRPMAALPPLPISRNHSPLPPPQPNPEEPARSRNHKTAKLPAPSIDRSTKPPLDRSLAPFDREPFVLGKKSGFADKPSVPAGRPLVEHSSKTQKPPVPPATDRHERNNPLPGRKPPVPKHGWVPERRETDENDGSSNRSPLRAEGRNLPIPVPSKPQPPFPREEENSLNEEWYVSYVTRPEAEAALRKINQDGTFLVRDSSKKTITNPYVLMVLYKDKVYNIQIRYQEESQVYLLGTGLRGKEDFLSVSDIIDYFKKMPLLLIDGKNRGSRYQCTLTYAAGYP
ncbi:lymphocyte cytosolic protein 2 isoform X3 [Ochotona curzoniae]|uniref:lymphocyte cytosolic protein 2 isoform X3 n=1 Tax=Ochotona curzoniae TaxID=130825 RepID=UPI001B352BD7|nr:lymphocyte cytosolic protein 2 isoform X3 [Ochotona curzoniae]